MLHVTPLFRCHVSLQHTTNGTDMRMLLLLVYEENLEILRHGSSTEALLRCVDKDLRHKMKNQVRAYSSFFTIAYRSP